MRVEASNIHSLSERREEIIHEMDMERMQETIQNEVSSARRRIGLTLSLVEQIVYAGLGTVLAICALSSLARVFKNIAYGLWHRGLNGQIVSVLDQVLLVLLIIELLYTVQVSLREHRLVFEPFLVVALVSAIRRILIITAEMTKVPPSSQPIFLRAMLELGVLSVMIVILVGSLILLQRSASAGDRDAWLTTRDSAQPSRAATSNGAKSAHKLVEEV